MGEESDTGEMPWEFHEPLSAIGAILRESDVDDDVIQTAIEEIRSIVLSALAEVEGDDSDDGSESDTETQLERPNP